MKELTILLLSVVIIGLIFYNCYKNKDLTKTKSSIDGRSYVVRKLDDKEKAADYLANLNKDFTKLVNHVSKDSKEGVDQLKKKFNPNNLTENIPGGKYTAYSVNKGEQLSLCLRNIDDNTFIDKNTVMFVSIHELAHVMTDEIGHTPKFWDNMRYLLLQASEIGIYNKVDYSTSPVNYCGKDITTTPLKKKDF